MNAVGYLRLSSKDQSKSLEYQESIIRDYCKRNKLKILEIFTDNGEGSYTFKRRSYIELEKFIKKHKGKCQYLIVLDHDRFSRNLPEALLKISELELKYNVKVVSTNESIDLDTTDSDVFMKRAFEYLIANRELLTIKNRTRLGIRNAKEKGRYLGKAPFGYANIKGATNTSTIEINDSQSFIIKKIFNDYELGVPQKSIHKDVISLGFKNKGNNAINDILGNCVYAGLIKISAFKNLPEKYVTAIHKPIISQIDFWRVQKLLMNKRKRQTRENEDFPLRGVVRCPCGRNLTAGWTKGNKKYYLYYKCIDHPSINIPGDKIHGKFEELLKKITLQKHQVELLNNSLSKLSNSLLNKQRDIHKEKIKYARLLKDKILKLQEKFITDQISVSTYKNWQQTFNSEKRSIENRFQTTVPDKMSIETMIKKLATGRINFYKIYQKSNVLQKQSLVRIIFRNSLTWDQGLFTSCYFNEALALNLRKESVKKLFSIRLPKQDSNSILSQN